MRRRKGFTAKALRRGDAKGCGRGGMRRRGDFYR
jgi:hypothetical protein